VNVFLEDGHCRLVESLGEFARNEMVRFATPHSDDEARSMAREAVRIMGKAGWLESHDCRTLCLFREAVAGISPLADCLFAIQGLATVPLRLEGSPAQRELWLGRAARGEAIGAFAMTEPEAGSDVANLKTSAQAEGEHWLLNGNKWLISNAGIADFYIVFASIDPTMGSRGIGAFLVTAGTPGLHFAGAQVLSAPHPLGKLEFRDCRAELLCREGFKLGMRTLDTMRISVAAAACGMAQRALHEALVHARSRHQFGQPLADFQLIQEKLALMAIGLEASRLLTYRAAWQRDQGQLRNSREVAMAKAHATETAQQVIDQSLQILGGQGMLADHPVEHLYRAVRALRIYEGTTEVQYLIIAKDLLKGA
jgi:alkylation response protein AidB-like acyl-CoA dehydrogenase